MTPRVGAAVLLNQSGSAVLRSGYGLFYERTPSAAGAFNAFERPLDTRFAPDGVISTSGLAISFRIMCARVTSRAAAVLMKVAAISFFSRSGRSNRNFSAVLRMAHHCYVLENGAVAFDGPASELLHDARIEKTYLGAGH